MLTTSSNISMEKDEQTLQGSEGEPNVEQPESPEVHGDDPLDLLTDPEEIRREAKKYRSISQRKPKVIVEKKPDSTQPLSTGDFVRKSDLERGATNKAKQLVGSEIAGVYEELVKIPLSGYDPLDAESIAINLRERYAIFKARQPEEKKDSGVSDLSTTNVVTGTGAGGNAAQKPDKKDPPNFSLPKEPKDWYVKP